jgi:hypothetical protein
MLQSVWPTVTVCPTELDWQCWSMVQVPERLMHLSPLLDPQPAAQRRPRIAEHLVSDAFIAISFPRRNHVI